MKLLLCCLILTVTLEVVLTEQSWWKTATFYQLYPRSFKDYNNDGIGDLKGITSKVDYLAEIGVTAIWMNPINPSPMADFGYDVSDYKGIDSIYGNLDDLKALIAALHAKNIKIVLDFVPNHSSIEHPWFNRSVNMEGNYTNYYVWRNANYSENGTRLVPNNWMSVFTGSAWQWNEKRQQYYLHQFLRQQPDLNVRDENVLRELREILLFWLDQGIDGIRVDAVKYLAEDELFRNNPTVPDGLFRFGDRIYTENINLTYDIVKEWGQLVKAKSAEDGIDRIMFLEIYDSMPIISSYSGEGDLSFVIPFNIFLVFVMRSGVTATNVVAVVNGWLSVIPKGSTPNWQVGNHDNHRISNRLGLEMIDSVNMILAMLPGIMVTYYGEEIGMEDTYLTWEQTVDPSGIRGGREHYQDNSRDPLRTPLQWDDTDNSGFCTNCTPWLPVNPNYWRLNVAAQRTASKSHMKVFQNLMKLRNSVTFQSNMTQFMINATDVNTLGILRWADVGEKYLLVVNFGSDMINPLASSILNTFQLTNVTQFTVTTASINAGYNEGERITLSAGMSLRPKAAVILQVNTGLSSSASSLVVSLTLLCLCFSLVDVFTNNNN